MPSEQIMTPREIAAYIHSQEEWNMEAKLAVWGTYKSWVNTFFAPLGSDLAKRHEQVRSELRDQLQNWGIIVE